ncbi:hypothetical protein B5E80_18985 [Flavonifractor sp. An135]|nr:hypothetical protein B5E80_18985 [Flavonifractor sp. An135]
MSPSWTATPTPPTCTPPAGRRWSGPNEHPAGAGRGVPGDGGHAEAGHPGPGGGIKRPSGRTPPGGGAGPGPFAADAPGDEGGRGPGPALLRPGLLAG